MSNLIVIGFDDEHKAFELRVERFWRQGSQNVAYGGQGRDLEESSGSGLNSLLRCEDGR
jgi:hypothetical protein